MRSQVPEPRKAPLAGNTVYTDRAFLARDMPTLESHLHYRIIDVSSIKELARRWYPRAYFASPPKYGGHRALADITDSIAELRYYRSAVFVPPPGPDTATAREIAARYGVPQADPVPTRPARHGGRDRRGSRSRDRHQIATLLKPRVAYRRPWWV